MFTVSLTDIGLEALSELSKLEELYLRKFMMISPQVFANFSNLTKLTCLGCDSISLCDFSNLIKNFKNIKEINTDCSIFMYLEEPGMANDLHEIADQLKLHANSITFYVHFKIHYLIRLSARISTIKDEENLNSIFFEIGNIHPTYNWSTENEEDFKKELFTQLENFSEDCEIVYDDEDYYHDASSDDSSSSDHDAYSDDCSSD